MYAAALAGNHDAQLCFIDRDAVDLAPLEEKMTPDEHEEQKDKFILWAHQAFERGDERIIAYVAMNLEQEYLAEAFPGLKNTADDPRFLEYSLFKLARMSATGMYARLIDSNLRGLRSKDPNVAALANPITAVKDEDAAIADAWAQDMFEKYFANTPVQSDVPYVCSYPSALSM